MTTGAPPTTEPLQIVDTCSVTPSLTNILTILQCRQGSAQPVCAENGVTYKVLVVTAFALSHIFAFRMGSVLSATKKRTSDPAPVVAKVPTMSSRAVHRALMCSRSTLATEMPTMSVQGSKLTSTLDVLSVMELMILRLFPRLAARLAAKSWPSVQVEERTCALSWPRTTSVALPMKLARFVKLHTKTESVPG